MKYIIIQWPESQYLMEFEDWQKHCYLINDDLGMAEFGSSAYFVEESWYNKNFVKDVEEPTDEEIENLIELSAEEFADTK